MVYTTQYASPRGGITRACDEAAIIGLRFDGQKYFGNILPEQRAEKEHPLLRDYERIVCAEEGHCTLKEGRR